MPEHITSKAVYVILRQYLRSRPNLGVGKAMLDAVLEPANPFDPCIRRTPRPWFVMLVVVGGTLLGCFAYFNDLI